MVVRPSYAQTPARRKDGPARIGTGDKKTRFPVPYAASAQLMYINMLITPHKEVIHARI